MSDIEGKVALVVGAAGEIGEAIAARLVAQRAKVIMVDRDASKLRRVQERLDKSYGETQMYVVDDTSESEVKSVIEKVEHQYGKLECLFNAVDFYKNKVSEFGPGQNLNAILTRNLLPIQLFCHYAILLMKRQGFGRIINVNSLDYLGVPWKSSYVAAKSALFGFTRAVALEVVKEGITVNSVVAGDTESSAIDISEEEKNILVKRLPVRKLGTVKDIAYAACFFASVQSGYITGQTLFVCGGKSVHFSMSA